MPHIHDKIDFTVEVFIVYKDTVLLRKHDKYRYWLSVGGHIELNEDPNQAAVREVKEEVNLDIVLENSLQTFQRSESDYKELIPPYFLNRHRVSDSHEHITLTYFAKTNTNNIMQLSKSEQSSDCRWFTNNELESLEDLPKNVKYYAQKALSVLSSKK